MIDAVTDPTAGDWIAPRLSGGWGSVTGVAPDGYEAYVRVLHPVPRGDEMLRWCDVAETTGRTVHPLVQWWRLVDADDPLDPVSELWDGDRPESGVLVSPSLDVLVGVLSAHRPSAERICFAIWDGWAYMNAGSTVRFTFGGADSVAHEVPLSPLAEQIAHGAHLTLPGRRYGLLSGPLNMATTLQSVGNAANDDVSANLMWPADRSWCVATEIDFDSTIVGCTEALAVELPVDPGLEAFRIEPDAGLHSTADLLNV